MIEGKQDREFDCETKSPYLQFCFALRRFPSNQAQSVNLSFFVMVGVESFRASAVRIRWCFFVGGKHGRQLSGWWKTSFQSSQIWLEEVVFSSQNSSPDGVFGDFDWFLIGGEVRTHVIGHSWWRFQAFWLVLDIYEASSTPWESISVYKLLSIIHSTYCFALRWKTRKVRTVNTVLTTYVLDFYLGS